LGKKHALLASALEQADADINSIRNLIQEQGISLTQVDPSCGDTHMHRLIMKKLSFEKYKLLFTAADKDVIVKAHYQRNKSGLNLLDIAVAVKNYEIIEKIISTPALCYIIYSMSPGRNGLTSLGVALLNNDHCDIEIVKLLLDNDADICLLNGTVQTALHRAVRLARVDIVSLLLETATKRGINKVAYVNKEDRDGKKALDLLHKEREHAPEIEQMLRPYSRRCTPCCTIQ